MKLLFFIFISSFSLNAFDAYNQNINEVCFYNLIYDGDNITSNYSFEGQDYVITKHNTWYTVNATEAFYYNNVCNEEPEGGYPNEDWIKLNMEEKDYHFMMALTANLLGFTLVFLVGFLFILQGRR